MAKMVHPNWMVGLPDNFCKEWIGLAQKEGDDLVYFVVDVPVVDENGCYVRFPDEQEFDRIQLHSEEEIRRLTVIILRDEVTRRLGVYLCEYLRGWTDALEGDYDPDCRYSAYYHGEREGTQARGCIELLFSPVEVASVVYSVLRAQSS